MNRVTLKDVGKKSLVFHVPKTVVIDGQQMQANLKVEFEIDFDAGVGEGGTCLVYHAYKIVEFAEATLRHKVILKEFYPVMDSEERIKRMDDGSLLIPESMKTHDVFTRKLHRFQHSYELFLGLHNEKNTNNYVVNADELIEGNGTWYLVADYNEACSLDEYMEKQPNLYDFCTIMKRVAEAVSNFHEMGYLHLDLTPRNIMVFQDGYVRIMDTDSMIKKDEMKNEHPALSWSDGYAAPELRGERVYQRLSKMGERSDIFSIGAIFYRYLFDQRIDILAETGELNRTKISQMLIDFSYEKDLQEKIEEKYERHQEFQCRCPQNAVRKLKELMRLLLSEKMACRYASMREVSDAIETILPLVEPKGVHILDNFRKNPDKVYGRDSKVKELEIAFDEQGEFGTHRLVMICGIGGIGKSTLSRVFAEKYLERYESIVEVAAESAKDAINSISIANFESENFEERLNLLKNLLHDRKSLLIVHDYNRRSDETFAYFRQLPCDVILTGWSNWEDSGVVCVELRQNDLSEDAALNIFKNAYLQNALAEENQYWKERLEKVLVKEQEELKELLRRVEYHPLTLKLLGMQMAYAEGAEQTPKEALEDLAQFGIMQDEWTEVQNQKDGGNVELGDAFYHMQNIYGTALKKGALKPEELEVLRYMTLLSVEPGICVDRFIDWTKYGKHAGKILTGLRKKGWLEYHSHAVDPLWKVDEKGETKGTYYMPMGIAEVLYRQEELKSTAENSESIIIKLKKWEEDEERIYVQSKTLVNLSETLLCRINESFTKIYGDLLHLCGMLLFEYANASRHKKKALKCWEKELPIRMKFYGENEFTASNYGNLAAAFMEFQEFEKAIEYQREALRIMEQMPKKDMQEIAFNYNNLAVIYMESKNWEKAIEYHEKVLDICNGNLTIPREQLGDTLCDLGYSYCEQGNVQKGIKYIEQGLSELIKECGEKNRWVAIKYSNLSMLYAKTGNCEKAGYYAKKSCGILEDVLGENHADTALAYNSLAVCMPSSSEERILYGEKAAKILNQVLGENHGKSITVCANLAMYYFEAGRKEEGICYGEKILKLHENLQEKSQNDSIMLYNNLGEMYSKNGDNEKGIVYLEKAKELIEAKGFCYYTDAKVYSNLAIAYWRVQKSQEAILNMQKSLEVYVQWTGPDSEDSIGIKKALDIMVEQTAMAEKQYQRVKNESINKLLEQIKKCVV